ncbi:Bug family tripartite tricarboxylate transporter substrate binding protein [Hydrogenophaga sp. ANAO-22]|jgi:tripartite-type tricarboxylate transporter receptor subunit TctC|uniref:Bug family tripartite tricarboxylate transporter substrate binding protein n=1 Tax=Hydrogenophaga sp. ANAO-22 TaxID=3166645 RepID=UPI0036D2E2C0
MQRRNLLASALALSVSAPAFASNRTLRIVVPFQAGSATDTTARVIADHFGKATQRNVIVDNKPGAAGLLAAREVIRADPSGDVVLMSTNTAITGINTLAEKPHFDPLTDLTPLTQVGEFAFVLVSHPRHGFKTTEDFIAHAKANPGKLNYASGSSSAIFAMTQLIGTAGIQLNHIPYNSEPPAVLDLVGGTIDMMFATPTTTMGFLADGKLNALMTTTKKRLSRFPALPTMRESGFTGIPLLPWGGFFGPKGMPKPVAQKLAREFNEVLTQPVVVNALAEHYITVATSASPDDFTAFVREQLTLSAQAVKDHNLIRK